jgi:hypothetical protein
VRDEFVLSASDNLMHPSKSILDSVLSENAKTMNLLRLRLSEVMDEFDLSASANTMAPSLPTLLSVL